MVLGISVFQHFNFNVKLCSLTVQRALLRVRAAQHPGLCPSDGTEAPQPGSGDIQDVNVSPESEL